MWIRGRGGLGARQLHSIAGLGVSRFEQRDTRFDGSVYRDGNRPEGGSAANSENARMRRSRFSTSSTMIRAACSTKGPPPPACRAMISSIVSRIGVSEFFNSCAIFRASTCQLASCVR